MSVWAVSALTCSEEHEGDGRVESPPRADAHGDQSDQEWRQNEGSAP